MMRQPSFAPTYVRYVIGLLLIGNVLNIMDRTSLAMLVPLIRLEVPLSDTETGLLIGVAFTLLYSVAGMPLGQLADRGDRSLIVAGSLAFWSFMTGACGLAQTFWQFFLARVGVGLGEAGYQPAAHSLICDYVQPERRALAFSIYSVGLAVGLVLGFMVTGWIADGLGWRAAFLVLGGPGLALAVVVHFSLREPPRERTMTSDSSGPRTSFLASVKWLASRRTYRFLCGFLIANAFVQSGLQSWLPSYFDRTYQLSLSVIGAFLGIGLGIAQGAGFLAGGYLASRKEAGPDRSLRTCGIVTLLAVPCALGTLFASGPLASVGCLTIGAILWNFPAGTVFAAIHAVMLPGLRGTGIAVASFLAALLGSGLAPFIVGLLSDWLSPAFGDSSLRLALLAPASMILLMALMLALAARAVDSETPVG